MGVTTAFVSALVIVIPVIIALIFSIIVWRCRLYNRRKLLVQSPQSLAFHSRNKELSPVHPENEIPNFTIDSHHSASNKDCICYQDIQLINSLSRTEPEQRVVRKTIHRHPSRECSPDIKEIGYA
jgi:hypothetical protein